MQALDDFAQVVRRNVGGHADRDAGACRSAARAARAPAASAGSSQRAVEVRLPVDRALAELRRAALRRSASASIRCSASPRTTSDRRSSRSCPARRSADSGTRTAAPSAPSLRSRRESPCGWNLPMTSPTVRADFLCLAPADEPELAHRVDDAALHRLQAVADERQRAIEHRRTSNSRGTPSR